MHKTRKENPKVQGYPVVQSVARVSENTAAKGGDCRTPAPESKDGRCVPITDCPAIDMLLKSMNADKGTIEYIQKAQCGFDGIPLVCCKTPDQVSTTPYPFLNFFTMQTTEATTPEPIAENLEYFPNREIPDRTICGSVKSTDQIAYGNATSIGEFPWLAAIVYKNKADGRYVGVQCGGSLINKRYVLTAAHCVNHHVVEPFRVLLGDWKLSIDPDCYDENDCAPSIQNLTIELKIPHPFYSKIRQHNDIGIIRLGSDVEFNEYIRPICLPPPNLPPLKRQESMTVAGWGVTENGTQSDVAQKATVNLLDAKKCLQILSGRKTIYTKELCAGSEKSDACSGDSGGPLMRTYKDQKTLNWFLEGLVGSGASCNLQASASIYTRVSKFTNWILRKVAETS